MAVVPFTRPSQSTLTSSSSSVASSAARSALLRAINRLQLLVLDNPNGALVVLGMLEGWLDE